MDNSVDKLNADSADLKPENKAENAVAAERECAAEREGHDHHKHKKRTIGNIIYDFGVFGSAAWLGVSASSAATANEAMYGTNKHFDWLRKMHTNVSNGLDKFFSKTLLKNSSRELQSGTARNMSMIFILGMGGHTMMAPIKWLEDHRQSNAAKIDKMLGTTPPDQEAIEKEPKQSWKSVLTGRMVSWASCFATIGLMGPKLTTKINDYFGEKGANVWMKMKPHANPAKVRRWSDLISFDILATALTATVTWACSRFFAKRHDKNFDTVEDSLYQLNPAAPNPLGDLDEDEKKASISGKAQMCAPQNNDSQAAKAFVERIKGQSRAHAQAAAFIDKIQRDESVGHAVT